MSGSQFGNEPERPTYGRVIERVERELRDPANEISADVRQFIRVLLDAVVKLRTENVDLQLQVRDLLQQAQRLTAVSCADTISQREPE